MLSLSLSLNSRGEIRGVGLWGGTAGSKEEHMAFRQPDESQQQIAPHVSHLFIFLFYFHCSAAESEEAAASGWKDHKAWTQNLNIRISVFIMVVWVSDLIILLFTRKLQASWRVVPEKIHHHIYSIHILPLQWIHAMLVLQRQAVNHKLYVCFA